ncbi:MAG TPA: hypothetical protein VGD34_20880 [Kribbella sp.]|jgi:hypothetical protein
MSGERTVRRGEAQLPADVDESLAGDYLNTLAVLLTCVARVTVPALPTAARSEIGELFDRTLVAIAAHDIPGLHTYGWGIVEALLVNCPDQVLAEAVQPGIDSVVDRFTRTKIAQVADWDLLIERYTEWKVAIAAGDPERTAAAIHALYHLPSDAAT